MTDDLESIAIVTIKRAPAMTQKGRREIAAWLREQASSLEEHGHHFTEGQFRARYLVPCPPS